MNLPKKLNKRTISLILGGGVGSRLYPLTKERSKPAVPIAGKYRLIDIPISNCLNSGLRKIFVLTQFNSASLNRHIKNTFVFDSFSSAFVDILAAEQTRANLKWFQGTADAVRQSLRNTRHEDFDLVLILSGDQLYQMDFSRLLNKHLENKADITIATIPVVAEDATSFGIMKVDKDDKIHSFVEKPELKELEEWRSHVPEEYFLENKHYLASMGIYVFSKKTLDELLEKNENAIDFGKEIIPYAIEGNYNVCSYSFNGYWSDIGDIKSFFYANVELAMFRPPFNLFHKNFSIYTRARLLPPAKIYDTKLTNAMIAEGSLVHASEIENAVIGIRSIIESGTVIRNAYIMGNDFYEYTEDMQDRTMRVGIGKNCLIENAIIDKEIRIGDNVVIRGDDSLKEVETEDYSIREGIVVINKHANIPSGTVIGKAN